MDYDAIFEEYYPLYRGQATVPDSSDREYQLGIALANNTVREWDRADGKLWNELFTTNQLTGSDNGAATTFDITATSLVAPTNMRKPGAYVTLTDPANTSNYRKIPVVDASDVYAKGQNSTYAYFIGSASRQDWALYFNGIYTPYSGWNVDYVYYRTPTFFTLGGGEIADMSDPNFIIQGMLKRRFVNSRNGFAYNDAREQATNALMNMVIENDSGAPGRGWNLLETDQTPGFGGSNRSSFFGDN
jgi:hypothetical protein